MHGAIIGDRSQPSSLRGEAQNAGNSQIAVHAEILWIIQFFAQAAKVPGSICVAVKESADMDFIDDAAFVDIKPGRSGPILKRRSW